MRRSDARTIYDEWAPFYPPYAHNALMQVEEAAVLSVLPSVERRCVLDAGCGSGRYAAILAQRGASRVIGVDLSTAMLQRARVSAAALVRADLNALPLKSALCDVVVCGLVVNDAPRLPGLVGELARVLRRGGVLVCSTLHPRGAAEGWRRTFDTPGGQREVPAHWHPIAEYEKACVETGLHIESRLEPLFNGQPVALVIRARRV